MKIQQWANKRKLAESWSYSYGIKPAKHRVESWERCCNDSACSFWLACLFLSDPTCFSPTYQRKSFRHVAWRNDSMFVHPTNTAVILDLKRFLINQKLFLSTSEYYYYYQWRKWTYPISEIAIIIVSLKFIDSFEATAFSFTNLLFPPLRFSLLYSGRFLACLPHFAPPPSRKKKSRKKFSPLCRKRHAKHWKADYLNEVYVNHCLGLSCGLDIVSINNR